MNKLEEKTQQRFASYIESMTTKADDLPFLIATGGQRLIDCLLNDGKILIGAQGASSANAQHFATALLHTFEVERPPLPAIDLSHHIKWCRREDDRDHWLTKPIFALGQPQDVLVLLTTHGHAKCFSNAIESAHEKGIAVLALTGQDGGVLASELGPEDLEIRIEGRHPALIRETHLFILHCFCALIDFALFGHDE